MMKGVFVCVLALTVTLSQCHAADADERRSPGYGKQSQHPLCMRFTAGIKGVYIVLRGGERVWVHDRRRSQVHWKTDNNCSLQKRNCGPLPRGHSVAKLSVAAMRAATK